MTDLSVLPSSNGAPPIRDFSRKRDRGIQLHLDGDTFSTIPGVPVEMARRFNRLQAEFASLRGTDLTALTVDQQDRYVGTVCEMLDNLLTDESAIRFGERLKSKENPITSEQLVEILQYIMEELGERPTTPAGGSSPSPAATGPTSTDGVPLEVSIPTTSPSLDI